MIGILNLKEAVRTESFKPYFEESTDKLFLHLEHVNSLKDKLKNFTLSNDELRLVEYSLNKLPYSPTGYRFEALQSQQTNLLYRAEGIIGDIWEKIKAFFRWIKEQFVKLFNMVFRRTSGTAVTPEVEKKTVKVVKETAKAKASTNSKSTVNKIETVQKAVENKKKAKNDKVDFVKQTEEIIEKVKNGDKQEQIKLVKILKSTFVKEAQISNDDLRTIALLESKIEPLGKSITNIFGYVGDGPKIVSLFSESIKDYIALGERVEHAVRDANLFSREGFFYNAEKHLSPFGSPVFKQFIEEASNIDTKYFNHFAVFFAGYNNTSILDFNEKKFSIDRIKAQLPEVETPDTDIVVDMVASFMESGLFSEIEKSMKEVENLRPRIQKRIEASINAAENSLKNYDPVSEDKAEAREAYKLITGFFRDILFVMHSYNNYIEGLSSLLERVRVITAETADLSKLSKEDLEICMLLGSLEQE